MRAIIFDISGPYGHFRKPYAPASPVTYPFPPPPTVLGILGAIIGLGKDEYHEALGWQAIRIGIKLLKPVQIYRTAVNLLNTKTADKYFRPRGEMARIQIPYEFLKEPAFRIYAANLPEPLADKLSTLLMAGQGIYTTTLGLAQCLADVSFVADTEAVESYDSSATVSVIPMNEGTKVAYEPGRRYERMRVPVLMDSDRVVHKYQEVVVAIDADQGRPVSVEGTTLYKVDNEIIAFF